MPSARASSWLATCAAGDDCTGARCAKALHHELQCEIFRHVQLRCRTGDNLFELFPSVPTRLSGSVELKDLETQKEVTLDPALPDAAYHVTVTLISRSEKSSYGSRRVKSIVKTESHFTIQVEDEPGSGKSVTFDWHLLR